MRIELAGGWVDLDRPRNPSALLVLTHGAGGGVATADVMAVRTGALAAGIAVGLLTQPHRVAGRSSPPKPEVQDAAWLAMLAALRRRRGLGGLPLVTGGRSNGARVACRTARESRAVAVIALAFPEHPPGKPQNSRLAELDAASVPVLVVQGDRDPFGMPPPAPGRTIVVIPGADHALRKGTDTIVSAVLDFVTSTAARANVRE